MRGPAELYGLTSAIVRAPMVRAAVPFMLGIAWSTWRTPAPGIAAAALVLISLAVALVLLLPVFRDSRWERAPAIGLWCFVFGMFWQTLRDPSHDRFHVSGAGSVEGPWAMRIDALNGITEKLVRADAAILAGSDNGEWRYRNGKVMLTLMRRVGERDPRVGDEVLIDAPLARIERVPDPGGFDRRAWAASRGMDLELFAPPEDWRMIGHRASWTDAFGSMRDRISSWLSASGLPQR
ncbi:MAG TPA: DUF4131 domain-containing protein, partial [Flavobacteriales bacterium]|nr:DUF4131 domain-containing protein [Flavobacteriales bacterium]